MIGNLRYVNRNEYIWWWELYKFLIIFFVINNGIFLLVIREICDLEFIGVKIEINNVVNFCG